MPYNVKVIEKPAHIDLKKDTGLTVRWSDGTESFYPVAYLRQMSPSAEMRELREEMRRNPLAVMPSSMANVENLRAEDAELVGNYAIRIHFSDGHDTGIFSWKYLREIDPDRQETTDHADQDKQQYNQRHDTTP